MLDSYFEFHSLQLFCSAIIAHAIIIVYVLEGRQKRRGLASVAALYT